MKAIVTGGAGFIGSHLVDALVARGDEVLVIDNLWTSKETELRNVKTEKKEKKALIKMIRDKKEERRRNLNPKAKLFEFDIQNSSIRTNFNSLGNIDYVFHLAALPRVPFSFHYPVETNNVNICGTLHVIALAVLVKAKRLVFSSSASIYGDQPVLPLKEDTPVNPLSPHALQKYTAEKYCQMLCQPEKPNRLNGAVCLRYFNVYGSRQSADNSCSAAIGIFLKNNKKGVDSTIDGDGEQTRDFTWVGDIVRANILAAESSRVGSGEVINIGSGKNYSINQLTRMIGGSYKHGPARPGDLRNSLADITKAKKLLGWEPEVSLVEGLAELKKIYGLV